MGVVQRQPEQEPAPREFQVVSAPAARSQQARPPAPQTPPKRTSYQAVDRRTKAAMADREQLYTVQVASFKTQGQANKYVEQLVQQKYDAFVAPVNREKPVDWYRVCIGETISPDQAKVLSAKLKPKFKDSFIYAF